jgi:hypothetical protein
MKFHFASFYFFFDISFLLTLFRIFACFRGIFIKSIFGLLMSIRSVFHMHRCHLHPKLSLSYTQPKYSFIITLIFLVATPPPVVCAPLPRCDPNRCQIVVDVSGCKFCSCPPPPRQTELRSTRPPVTQRTFTSCTFLSFKLPALFHRSTTRVSYCKLRCGMRHPPRSEWMQCLRMPYAIVFFPSFSFALFSVIDLIFFVFGQTIRIH